jgi:uncharacterized protein (TIGR03067 family)
MKRLYALLFLAAVSLAAADAPDESARFNGTWLLVRAQMSGIEMPKDVLGKSTMTINGNKHTVQLGEDPPYEGTHRFDPTQDPKAYDTTVTTGAHKGDKQYGIYKLDGDELTICIASSGFPRPKDFKAPAGSNDTLTVWKRQSK